MFRRNWVKLLLIPLVLLVSMAIEVEAGRVRVKGYYRKDGTYVRPHYRTAPDSNPYNNYSFPGNYNPNTGKITPGDPQKYLDRYYNRSTGSKPSRTYTQSRPILTETQSIKQLRERWATQAETRSIKRLRERWATQTRTYTPSRPVPTTTQPIRSHSEFKRTILQMRQVLNGAVLIADDAESTYLGKISGHYESNSIFNQYGQYGSDYALKSIFNNYGVYGSDYSTYSPFSKYAISPPYIAKNGKIIARLSTNKSLKVLGNVVLDPYVLMFIYDKDKR